MREVCARMRSNIIQQCVIVSWVKNQSDHSCCMQAVKIIHVAHAIRLCTCYVDKLYMYNALNDYVLAICY